MSPRVDRLLALSGALLLGFPAARGQTIADYSRAQRLLIESAMSQAAARSAGGEAPTPAGAASVPAAAPPASTPRPAPPALPVPGPAVQVSGVFASSTAAVAEIVVNATPYLLRAGQGVPGTMWRVQSIAVDRVVLSRPGRRASAGALSALQVFDLPALR